MDTPADSSPLARGLRSVKDVPGGAKLYEVVFGQGRSRARKDAVSFDDIEAAEALEHPAYRAWLVTIGIHVLIVTLPIVALMPSRPVDTVPEQGISVELVAEPEAAAGRTTMHTVSAGAKAAAEGSVGRGEGAEILAAPDATRKDVVPVGEAATVAPPAPSFAAGPATPPARDVPPASGSVAGGSGSVTAEELKWEGAIVERIERRKRYPKSALAAGVEDEVVLRLVIDRDGKLVRASVAKSRGHGALDAEVLALARRASPYPRPPASVAGATVSMLVPVEFLIRKAK